VTEKSASDLPDEELGPKAPRPLYAPVNGNVWKIEVEPGQHVDSGQALVIVESMKMETAIPALHAGIGA